MSRAAHFRMIPSVGLELAIDLLWAIAVHWRRLFGLTVRTALRQGKRPEFKHSFSGAATRRTFAPLLRFGDLKEAGDLGKYGKRGLEIVGDRFEEAFPFWMVSRSIIRPTLIGVRQDFVGSGDLAELSGDLGVPRMHVRMGFPCALPVGRTDLFNGGRAGNAKELVVIRHSRRLSRRERPPARQGRSRPRR